MAIYLHSACFLFLVSAPSWVQASSFEENRGQRAGRIRYMAPPDSFRVSFEADAAVMEIGEDDLQESIRLRVGKPASVRGEQKMPQVTRYMFGGTSNQMIAAPHFGAVRFHDVAANVDAIYRASGDSLSLRFEIRPGGNPKQVKMEFKNAARVAIDPQGNIQICGRQNKLIMSAPEVYQVVQEMKIGVPATFKVIDNVVHFDVETYEAARTLFIEPRFIPFTAAQATKQLARSVENTIVE